MIDYTELTAEALERRAEQNDSNARDELTRRSLAAASAPAPKPDFAAAAPFSVSVPDGHVVVRDTHACTCGHPASETRLDLNTHSMDAPHRCLVDTCPCSAFEYEGPFTVLDSHAVPTVIHTGRFAPQGG